MTDQRNDLAASHFAYEHVDLPAAHLLGLQSSYATIAVCGQPFTVRREGDGLGTVSKASQSLENV